MQPVPYHIVDDRILDIATALHIHNDPESLVWNFGVSFLVMIKGESVGETRTPSSLHKHPEGFPFERFILA